VSNYLLTASGSTRITRLLTKFSVWLRKHEDVYNNTVAVSTREFVDRLTEQRNIDWKTKFLEGGAYYQHTLWNAIAKKTKQTVLMKRLDKSQSF